MSKPRNGNRKCPNCRHFYAAHSYVVGSDLRPCTVPNCPCVSLAVEKRDAQVLFGLKGDP